MDRDSNIKTRKWMARSTGIICRVLAVHKTMHINIAACVYDESSHSPHSQDHRRLAVASYI